MKWESMDKCLRIENVVRVYLTVHPRSKKSTLARLFQSRGYKTSRDFTGFA